jgi:hypothetical protein
MRAARFFLMEKAEQAGTRDINSGSVAQAIEAGTAETEWLDSRERGDASSGEHRDVVRSEVDDARRVARVDRRRRKTLPCLRLFVLKRRQNQAHGRTLAATLPLDLAAELLGEALDQPAAEPRVGASGIDSLAVVGDRQAKRPRDPL